ncbi:MAG: endonuclease III [Clostridia bacterium]|nr:endonuclease III [Clostridia bacterium]
MPRPESQKAKKIRAAAIVDALKGVYPAAECALQYEGDPWRLLVMGRLSAQCTDARVNTVAKTLFAVYPNAEAMANADPEEVGRYIFSCGLYKTKARDLVAASQMLVTTFDGKLPDTMEALLTLPGVGRKIANLLLGDIYQKPAIVADTHCIRISRRMGLVAKDDKTPEKVEKTLVSLIAPEEQSDFCHRIVLLGREYCPARGKDCSLCPIAALCPKIEV